MDLRTYATAWQRFRDRRKNETLNGVPLIADVLANDLVLTRLRAEAKRGK